MAIRLTSLDQMPKELRRSLKDFDSCFTKTKSICEVLEKRELYDIASELDRLCADRSVIGNHFTRAVSGEIIARGLESFSGADRRRKFLLQYGHLFSETQRDRISRAWGNFFDRSRPDGRDGKIWFNLTLDALENGGADDLLTYFGGEIVNMPLTGDEEIAAILRTLGQPLVVEAALSPKNLHVASEIPFGRTWISTYHVNVNRAALQHDVDAFTTEQVSAEQIVCVRVAHQDSALPSRWTLK
jgi:hypothetical protein